MKQHIESWSIEKLFNLFKEGKFSFQEYQRNPKIWSLEKKKSLIDSILRDFDIPKLYFYKSDDGYDVVDGQQRIEAITEFLMNKYRFKPIHDLREESKQTEKEVYFSELKTELQTKIKPYPLSIVIIDELEDDDELNLLFFRLQLGEPLNSGEKLNSMTGNMRDFIFRKGEEFPKFFKIIKSPKRRFGDEMLLAQICINYFSRYDTKDRDFARCRFNDLKKFFNEYAENPIPVDKKEGIENTLAILGTSLGDYAEKIHSKGLALSIFFVVDELKQRDKPEQEVSNFYDFLFNHLDIKLKEQIKKGFLPDPEFVPLLEFQKNLTQAGAEDYSIKNRHDFLMRYYAEFKKAGKILGE
ncbi:MAG: DUF262 domain-containing protein [Candidatus Altiarchaeia archaeon]